MGESTVRVLFGALSNFAVLVRLVTLFINRFLNGIFPPKREIAPYISKLIPTVAINDLPEAYKY